MCSRHVWEESSKLRAFSSVWVGPDRSGRFEQIARQHPGPRIISRMLCEGKWLQHAILPGFGGTRTITPRDDVALNLFMTMKLFRQI